MGLYIGDEMNERTYTFSTTALCCKIQSSVVKYISF
jgi:hypothetical protein